MGSFLDRLECARCGRERPFGPDPATLCGCGSPLLARYRIETARKALSRDDLARRDRSIWRLTEMLPGVTPVTLGEGGTPLLRARRLGGDLGLERLLVKDESVNPTGSFKARGLSVAVSVAAAQGVQVVAAPSAGNAGAALAAYGARAGMEVHIALPETTPPTFVAEARRKGAHVRLVPGTIADAGRALRDFLGPPTSPASWLDLSTLREPFRIEGKKTMGYEIAEQLDYRLPDWIVYPTGGGTGLIGIWKAFQEMQELGWIGPERPRMVAVQAEGCAPIVRAFEQGASDAMPWSEARTEACGLRVPSSLGDFLMLRAIRESGGTALSVTDREMMEAAGLLATREGIDACPEGGAALAGAMRLRRAGTIPAEASVVILNTGTGLKYFQ